MARAGRPRLTPEDYQVRLEAYCAKYGVRPTPEGIPPFPAGRRETPQHREWIKLYKAHSRLARRQRGQCERCGSPCSDGSVFCEAHRASSGPARAGAGGVSAGQRRELLARQEGRCPICGQAVGIREAVEHGHPTGRLRGLVHPACSQLIGFAETLGPEALENTRRYLWGPPPGPRRRR